MNPEFKLQFTARVQDDQQGLLDGAIVGAADETVMVEFAQGQAPSFAIGEYAEVSIARAGMANSLSMQVIARKDDGEIRRFTFRTDEEGALEFLGVISLRGSARIKPSPGEPVAVNLQAGANAPFVRCELFNLSQTGMAVLLMNDEEPNLREAYEVSVRFQLPGEKQPSLLSGQVRNREICGERVKYGIFFDEQNSRHFEVQRKVLKRYVLRRQMEELQKVREAAKSKASLKPSEASNPNRDSDDSGQAA